MISSFTLALACAAQGVDHATLHPRGAALYIECPDVRAALTAYEQAPAARMLRDAAVGEALEKISKAVGIDRSRIAASILAPLGVPTGADPFGRVLDAARTASSFSLSLSVAEEEPGETRRALEALNTALAALDRIAEAAEKHERAHAAPPSDLKSLQLPDELARDPWGRAFEYRVLEDGSFVVSTLGRDGEVGGEGVDADLTHESALEPIAAAELLSRFARLALVRFATEGDALRAVEWFGSRVPLEPHAGSTPAGWTRHRIEVDAGFADAWLARSHEFVALGDGAVSVEQLAARAAGALPGLSLADAWRQLDTHSGPQRGALILRGLGDSVAIANLTHEDGPLGDGELASLIREIAASRAAWRMQLDAGRFVTEVHTESAGATSWIGLLGSQPAPAEAFAYVPSDAVGFFAARLDSEALGARLSAMLASDGETALASALDELEAKHGFDLEQDICANLSGGVAAYLLPLTSIGLPNMGMVAALRDAAAFERGIRGLFKALGEAQAQSLSVRESKYRDAPTWTVSFAGEGGDARLAAFMPTPTLAIVKGRAILSLTSLRAKKEIKRALGEDDGPHAVASDETRLPRTGSFAGWMDWAGAIDGLYAMARSAAAMFGGQLELPIDLPALMTALPESSRVFTRFFEPTTSTVRAVDGGLVLRWESSFGPEVWIGIVGLALGVRQSGAQLVDARPSAEDAPAQPVDERRDQALRALASLSSRIAVFRLDQGRLPASLDELTQPTTNYPRGFLEGLEVAADPWGAAFVYVRAADGASYRLGSKGPDGVDAAGAGDDVLAP